MAPEHPDTRDLRPLGKTGLAVTPVALGCWPIAGVTTLGANEADSLATVQRALDLGINHLDTAHVYGPQGESEVIVGKAIAGRRDGVVLATKVGIHYQRDQMQQDARPATLRAECEKSLRRLGVEHVDLLYLHSPDPNVPIEDSAGALGELRREGKATAIGASNCKLDELQAFHGACPLAAAQLPYNLLQRDIEQRTLPWCLESSVSVMVYWPLMKGLLAGRLPRDGRLEDADNRRNYPMYRGDEWRKNQLFVDRLRAIADSAGRTVAQLVVNRTFSQPGITSALCGAKRAWQIEETAGAMGWRLTPEQLERIDAALAERGQAAAKRVFT